MQRVQSQPALGLLLTLPQGRLEERIAMRIAMKMERREGPPTGWTWRLAAR